MDKSEFDLDFDNIDIEFTEIKPKKRGFNSQLIILCKNDQENDYLRKYFGLGARTKSGRGKYETNVINAKKLIEKLIK